MSIFGDLAHGAETIFADLEKVIGVATPLLPVVAAVNTIQNPTASNAGVTNAQKAIALVTPLVQMGNEQAKQIAAQDANTQLTGAQKLQNALDAVQAATSVLASTGAITTPYASLLPLLLPAINAAVAAVNAPADPTKPATAK